MKKLLFIIGFLMVLFAAKAQQNIKGFNIEALERLESKRAFVLGGTSVYATTKLDAGDTTLVTKKYLNPFIVDAYKTGGDSIYFEKANGDIIAVKDSAGATSTPQTLVFDFVVLQDYLQGPDSKIVLSANMDTLRLTNLPDGGEGSIAIIQNTTGGYGISEIVANGLTTLYASIDTTSGGGGSTGGITVELDPTVASHIKAITTTDITNWNIDNNITNELQDLSILNDTIRLTQSNSIVNLKPYVNAAEVDPVYAKDSLDIFNDIDSLFAYKQNPAEYVNTLQYLQASKELIGVRFKTLPNGTTQIDTTTATLTLVDANYDGLMSSSMLADLNEVLSYLNDSLNIQQWNEAYDNINDSVRVTGDATKTITIYKKNSPAISGTFVDKINDADADPTNEIQDLNLNGNILELSGSDSTVNLAAFVAVPETDPFYSVDSISIVRNKLGVVTDNAIVRFDGTTGKRLQNSNVVIDDIGKINYPSSASIYIGESTVGPANLNYRNIGIGYDSTLMAITNGYENIALGRNTMRATTIGGLNVAIGSYALRRNTTGYGNVALGPLTMDSNTTGHRNVVIGYYTLRNTITGRSNVAIGEVAGTYITGGKIINTESNYNIYLGASTKAKEVNTTNEIVIGYSAIGKGDSTIVLGDTSIKNLTTYGTVIHDPADSLYESATLGQVISNVNDTAMVLRSEINSSIPDLSNYQQDGDTLTFDATKYDIKNKTNWDAAYSNTINSAKVFGTYEKEVQLYKSNGDTIKAEFTDLIGDTLMPPQTLLYTNFLTQQYDSGRDAKVVLIADITTYTLQNVPDGGSGQIALIQDAYGGHGVLEFAHQGLYVLYAEVDTTLEDSKQDKLIGDGFVVADNAGNITYDNTEYQPLLSNPVTGTGTNTYLSLWNGISSITNASVLQSGSILTYNGDYAINQPRQIPDYQTMTTYVDAATTGGTTYLGTWNASTNTPTLSDATGNQGDMYAISVTGTQNLGSGSIVWTAGGFAIHNGVRWEYVGSSNAVTSVNTYTGIVSLYPERTGNLINIRGNATTINIADAPNVSAAYNGRISSFTTTGNSGAASFTSNVLNIPNYTLAGLGFSDANYAKLNAFNTYTESNRTNTANATTTINATSGVGSLRFEFAGAFNGGTIAQTDGRNDIYAGGTSYVFMQNEFRLQNKTTPVNLQKGTMFFDIDDNTFRGYNGTSWVDLGLTGGGTYTEGNGIDITSNIVKLDVNNMGIMSGASVVDADYFIIRDESIGTDYKVAAGGLKTYFGTYTPGTGLVLSGTTLNHSNSVTASNFGDTGVSRGLAFGSSFVVPYVTYDAQGHIKTKSNLTLSLPAAPSVNITQGNGMLFPAISLSGSVSMALPLDITYSSLSSAGTPGLGHSHEISILGTPSNGNVISYNSSINGFEWIAQTGGGDMYLANTQTVTGLKSFNANMFRINGATSGYSTLNAAAVAGTTTLTLQGTTGTIYSSGGTDIPVADGGTGRSSHTAYGLLAGGTTTTGSQQSLLTGNSGSILESSGSGSLPTWALTTGTGYVVKQNTPTLTTPIIGVATATSVTASDFVQTDKITIGDNSRNQTILSEPVFSLAYKGAITYKKLFMIPTQSGSIYDDLFLYGTIGGYGDGDGKGKFELQINNRNNDTIVAKASYIGSLIKNQDIVIYRETTGAMTVYGKSIYYTLPWVLNVMGTFEIGTTLGTEYPVYVNRTSTEQTATPTGTQIFSLKDYIQKVPVLTVVAGNTTLDANRGLNADIVNLSSNTTLLLTNIAPNMTGNIKVTSTTAHTLTFAASGYTIMISPSIIGTGDAVTVSGAGLSNPDVYSYWVAGTTIFINGTKGYL